MAAFATSRGMEYALAPVGVFEDDSSLLQLDAGRCYRAGTPMLQVSLINGDNMEQDILVETRAWDL